LQQESSDRISDSAMTGLVHIPCNASYLFLACQQSM
jgi:hypothetical protein